MRRLSMWPVVLNFSEPKTQLEHLFTMRIPRSLPSSRMESGNLHCEQAFPSPGWFRCIWLEDYTLRNIALGSHSLMFSVEWGEMML